MDDTVVSSEVTGEEQVQAEARRGRLSRRGFLSGLGGLGAVGRFGALGALGSAVLPTAARAHGGEGDRMADAYAMREAAARRHEEEGLPDQHPNGDEQSIDRYLGSFTKALPHNLRGVVDPAAYAAYQQALDSGEVADFEAIPLGGTAKLANPMASYAFLLEGADPHQHAIATPPKLTSAWCAAEMVEVYWRALTRDVAFRDYGSDPLIAAAVDDLGALSDYRGPEGHPTVDNLFRGHTPGDLTGPLVSQFFYLPYNFGLARVDQKFTFPVPGDDFMTSHGEWLAIQNGATPTRTQTFDPTPRYLRTGRDLAEWVHRDFTYQGGLVAALILLGLGGQALDAGNPYRTLRTQGGFITLGAADVLDLVGRTSAAALKAAWYQKWHVHRRLRPEAFAGLVHAHLRGPAMFALHPDVYASDAVHRVHAAHGSYLLPMAYPEGCPTHPAYPAGHATLAGAFTTVLKAFFNESFVLPSPVVPSADGLSLEPWDGELTVGGELNKLAFNIASARDTGGVHWRLDGEQGLVLGERLAIECLRDLKATYREEFQFSLTRFDGETITI